MVEAMSNPEDIHPRPIVSVDLAIFALTQDGLEVLLTKRGAEPFVGSWALPVAGFTSMKTGTSKRRRNVC